MIKKYYKMKRLYYIIILMLFTSLLTSCEVDFSPNAEWKEVPVVYCILNQDEDTTWARVQKCYLGENDLNSYTNISDSMNYSEGAIEVKLLQWKGRQMANNLLVREGDAPIAEFNLDYTEKLKDDGVFGYKMQPLYACKTKGKLDSNSVYQLVVIKTETGDTLAKSETSLLGGNRTLKTINGFYQGSRNWLFKFAGRGNCTITWDTWLRSRLYQPWIRFYYKSNGEEKYVDINCSDVINGGRSSVLSVNVSQGSYFADIKTALQDDPAPKQYVHHVDITIDACGEDLKAYLASIRAINNGSQNTQIYTNIDNGVGVFSARRTMTVTVPSDSAVGNGTYMAHLRELNVGFE